MFPRSRLQPCWLIRCWLPVLERPVLVEGGVEGILGAGGWDRRAWRHGYYNGIFRLVAFMEGEMSYYSRLSFRLFYYYNIIIIIFEGVGSIPGYWLCTVGDYILWAWGDLMGCQG